MNVRSCSSRASLTSPKTPLPTKYCPSRTTAWISTIIILIQWTPATNNKKKKMNPRILATKQKIKSILTNFELLLNAPTIPIIGKTINTVQTYSIILIGLTSLNVSNPKLLLKNKMKIWETFKRKIIRKMHAFFGNSFRF